jgi:hypothetical protein
VHYPAGLGLISMRRGSSFFLHSSVALSSPATRPAASSFSASSLVSLASSLASLVSHLVFSASSLVFSASSLVFSALSCAALELSAVLSGPAYRRRC